MIYSGVGAVRGDEHRGADLGNGEVATVRADASSSGSVELDVDKPPFGLVGGGEAAVDRLDEADSEAAVRILGGFGEIVELG